MKIKIKSTEKSMVQTLLKHVLYFFDEQAILFDDPEHSDDEERFLILGMSETAKICLVCHCYRNEDETIRIISARKATKKEKKRYVRGI